MQAIWLVCGSDKFETVRSILAALLDRNGTQLYYESLRTFMVEAEAIINCRPLTVSSTVSPDCPDPPTPNQLLTMKSEIVLVLCNERIYIPEGVGVVFITWPTNSGIAGEETSSNPFKSDRSGIVPTGAETYPNEDGHVRKVNLAIADASLDHYGQENKTYHLSGQTNPEAGPIGFP